jgi:hypothetical protein
LNLGSVGCSTDRGARREHIAVLAEQFVRGERPSYDNERVIDDEQLRQFVAAAGGLGDPVVLVTRSAARLARAWESLGDDLGAVEVPAARRWRPITTALASTSVTSSLSPAQGYDRRPYPLQP